MPQVIRQLKIDGIEPFDTNTQGHLRNSQNHSGFHLKAIVKCNISQRVHPDRINPKFVNAIGILPRHYLAIIWTWRVAPRTKELEWYAYKIIVDQTYVCGKESHE
jgi:hypothetical protein